MKLIWSKSKSPLSLLIRTITGEDCSHFAIVLYDGKPGEIMFESNLLGTHPCFYQNSMKTHTLVHQVDVPCDQAVEDKVWDTVVKKFDGKGYDFLGVLYLGWRKILYRALRSPIPAINKWASPHRYFCDELFELVSGLPGVPEIPVSNGMKTPHDVWTKFDLGASCSVP